MLHENRAPIITVNLPMKGMLDLLVPKVATETASPAAPRHRSRKRLAEMAHSQLEAVRVREIIPRSMKQHLLEETHFIHPECLLGLLFLLGVLTQRLRRRALLLLHPHLLVLRILEGDHLRRQVSCCQQRNSQMDQQTLTLHRPRQAWNFVDSSLVAVFRLLRIWLRQLLLMPRCHHLRNQHLRHFRVQVLQPAA